MYYRSFERRFNYILENIDNNYKPFGVMVFNATFNNISVTSWRSVLLVEESGVPGENHRPVTDKHDHIIVSFHQKRMK